MTEQQLIELGPAFSRFLGSFRRFFLQERPRGHFRDFCRGLLTDLPRKSVEPVALEAGTAVRTLQEFLTTTTWDHLGVRDELQRQIVRVLPGFPGGSLRTVGIIDETSALKKGDKTPGVQRQYLGCVGKRDNGIVTVHLAVARGSFKALLDADLYLPQSWDQDRERCRQASIPDTVRFQPKWKIALTQLARAERHGLRFDWLTFDEGYGGNPRLLVVLDLAKQSYVGEVPISFSCRRGTSAKARRADAVMASAAARRQPWQRVRLKRQTEADAVWEAKALPIRLSRTSPARHRLLVARNVRTGEVKYFVTNAVRSIGLATLLRVALVRWNVEHCFRLAKSEIGLTHFEGRSYVGLMRHLVLGLVSLTFVAMHTERLRGEKPGVDAGAGVPSAQCAMWDVVEASARNGHADAHIVCDRLSSEAQQGRTTIQEEAQV